MFSAFVLFHQPEGGGGGGGFNMLLPFDTVLLMEVGGL